MKPVQQDPYVEVVVPLPIRTRLTYACPKDTPLQVGMRVLVQLGPRRVTGYVVKTTAMAPAGFKIKPVLDVLDDEPLFTTEILGLCEWVSKYYHEALGEVIATALPGGLNQKDTRIATLTEAGRLWIQNEEAESPQAMALFDALEQGPRPIGTLNKTFKVPLRVISRHARAGRIELEYALKKGTARQRLEKVAIFQQPLDRKPVSQKETRVVAALEEQGEVSVRVLNKTFNNVRNNLKRLVEDGVVRIEERRVFRDVLGNQTLITPDVSPPPQLTPEQKPVVDTLVNAVKEGRGRFLLQGVTGSGKTEVYLRAIEAVLAAGKGAIVLVPEIALTPQLASRFQGRFGNDIALLHSGLSTSERLDQWTEIAQGRRRVVVGARSAIFAPIPRLGLVVVDEEHETSFKQEDRPRYHARDLAMVRGAQSGCPVVLGSATPSMESLSNAHAGRYELLLMRERVQSRPLPALEVVDLRTGRASGKGLMVSPQLGRALRETIDRNEQAIIFINRRGFASFVMCSDCGFIAECPSCSISLSYTRRFEQVRCHYCGFSRQPPSQCESCKGTNFEAVGSGTERIEEELRELVGPHVGIGRLDRDTAQGKGLMQVLTDFREQRLHILIGTQMVAKGHDFPGVTLVGVLQADQGLRFPDFRAAERTYQLLTQVAGRAGRGEKPGRVLIQTYAPEHYVIQSVVQQDHDAFVARELEERRGFGYPPSAHLALILITHEDAQKAQDRALASLDAVDEARKAEGAGDALLILGPTFAPIQRLKNKTRLQILLKCSDRDLLHRILSRFEVFVGDGNLWGSLAIDVDPINLL